MRHDPLYAVQGDLDLILLVIFLIVEMKYLTPKVTGEKVHFTWHIAEVSIHSQLVPRQISKAEGHHRREIIHGGQAENSKLPAFPFHLIQETTLLVMLPTLSVNTFNQTQNYASFNQWVLLI